VATELSLTFGLAGRYSNALFELARDQGELDAVGKDLAALGVLLADSEEFAQLISSPVLSRVQQGKAIDALLNGAKAHDLVRKFIGLLARNRRLYILAQVIRIFRDRLADHRGEVGAEVISARVLDEEQIEALKSGLSKALGRHVNLASQVDQGLLGGLIVRVGSRMLDTSIRTQLQNLRLVMKGVG